MLGSPRSGHRKYNEQDKKQFYQKKFEIINYKWFLFFMQLKIEILFSSLVQGNPIHITHSGTTLLVDKDIDASILLELDYEMQDFIELLTLKNMLPGKGQQISIRGILINGVLLKDWRKFCRFDIMDNRFADNSTRQAWYELCFNGTLFLDVSANSDQFFWFKYYHSACRTDFVYDNDILDCNAPHHCFGVCASVSGTTHKNLFLNSPYHPDYSAGSSYDYGCFGCSMTSGTALLRGQEWPALLKKNNSVINLSVAGLGADGIFLNLYRALDSFDIKRIVILLPDLSRRLLRFTVDGQHFRIPITVNSVPSVEEDNVCVWFRYPWLWDRVSVTKKNILSDFGDKYSKKIILRMLDFLKRRGLPFWLSSWSPETYEFLSLATSPDRLLPMFYRDRGALDNRHGSAKSHLDWLSSVYPVITKQ